MFFTPCSCMRVFMEKSHWGILILDGPSEKTTHPSRPVTLPTRRRQMLDDFHLFNARRVKKNKKTPSFGRMSPPARRRRFSLRAIRCAFWGGWDLLSSNFSRGAPINSFVLVCTLNFEKQYVEEFLAMQKNENIFRKHHPCLGTNQEGGPRHNKRLV